VMLKFQRLHIASAENFCWNRLWPTDCKIMYRRAKIM